MPDLSRRVDIPERMDDPRADPWLVRDALWSLAQLNRWLGGWRVTRLGFQRLAACFPDQREWTLLDVGSGAGDGPEYLARWAARHGHTIRCIRMDLRGEMLQHGVTVTHGHDGPLAVQADVLAWPFREQSVDILLASLFLHHFTDAQIVVILRQFARTVRRGLIINDLLRAPLAFHAIRLLTRTVWTNPLCAYDGPVSVQRACTLEEWRRLGVTAELPKLTVRACWPYRVLLVSHWGPRAAL